MKGKISVKIIVSFLYFISAIIPKKKKLWVFGSWDGHLYADNSKYMYEYVCKNCPEICCVWISKEKEIVQLLKTFNHRAALSNSLHGVWTLLRAKVWFETSGYNDLSYFVAQNNIEIQLWHGMGFKKVGTKSNIYSNWINAKDSNHMIRDYTYDLAYWMVASQDAKEKYADSYLVPLDHFVITGQPKDDEFIILPDDGLYQEIIDRKKYSKVIFYLPTHRNFGKNDNKCMLSAEKLREVNRRLCEMNAVMLYKPHYNDKKNFERFQADFTNIIFLLDFEKYGDIYQILPFCDAMISDYSGIIFGFLNADKPIILFPYDYDSYVTDDMGFCYDYYEVAAGPVCFDWNSVLDEVEKLVNGKDDFSEKRHQLRERFCPYTDGKNKERVYNAVLSLLDKGEKR